MVRLREKDLGLVVVQKDVPYPETIGTRKTSRRTFDTFVIVPIKPKLTFNY